MYAYVGSRTTRERNARGDGISVYRVLADGRLEPVQVLSGLVNPSYLVLNRRGDRLYSVHGDRESVSVLAVSPESGRITHLQEQGCEGRNPVHLTLDAAERHLLVANHLSGCVVVMPVHADGRLGPVRARADLPGEPGPHRKEQPFSKPHYALFDPTGQWLVVPDKGLDRVFAFGYRDGTLVAAASPPVKSRESAGPRHAAFHPTLARAYVVNELDSTVTVYRFDAATGELAPIQWLPLPAACYVGDSRAAGIVVDPEGRTLYASNRGEDAIAVFSIDPHDGRLEALQRRPSGGRTPRSFTLLAEPRRLYVLNEDSDEIVVFALERRDGRLAGEVQRLACGSPVCMVFSAAAAV